MYAEFSDKNIVNWLRFLCNFTTKSDSKTIRKFISQHYYLTNEKTSKALYNKYWK